MVGRQPAGESVVAGACSRLPVQLSAHEDNRSLARSSDGGCAYVCVSSIVDRMCASSASSLLWRLYFATLGLPFCLFQDGIHIVMCY